MSSGNDKYHEAYRLMSADTSDLNRVLELLQESSALGSAEATYAMATWHLHGNPPLIRRNVKVAARLLRAASILGSSEASYDLAVCYEKGVGVKKSKARAFELYMKAALDGDGQAYFEVGRMYQYGDAVSKSKFIADIWWEKGQKLGIDPADRSDD